VCVYVSQRRRGRVLVLLHDLTLTSSAYEMRPLFESLRWRRPTVAIDFPGFGLSERGPSPCSPAKFAGILQELFRELHRSDGAVDVVSLGRGSESAALVARDQPELVRSLVMIEPSGLIAARRRSLFSVAALVTRLVGERIARPLCALMSAGVIVRSALRSRFYGAPDEGLVAYVRANARVGGARPPPLEALACPPRGETEAIYHALTVPVLVVHDTRGPRIVELEAFLRGSANRFAVRISPTRGMPHFERPTDTVAALDRFWLTLPRAVRDRATR
jgi:pimeloyl-ACP methyl ester carboxylesterase